MIKLLFIFEATLRYLF